jgi:Cytochrome c554 and c-prime
MIRRWRTGLAPALVLLVVAGSCTRRRSAGGAGGAAEGPPALALLYAAEVQGQVAAPATPPGAPGGLARRATLVDRARLDAPAIVQVDAGDFLPAADDPASATPAAFERRARLVMAAYQRMDVDAVTLGPRELAVESKLLRQWAKETKLPVVLANVMGESGVALFEAGRIVTAGGHKVGIFGVVELSPEDEPLRQRRQLRVEEPVVMAAESARTLRGAGAELVVGLVNAPGGSARARAIAGTPTIDVVIYARQAAGDNGQPGAVPLLASVPPGGTHLGRIDVRGSPGAWKLQPRLQPLGAGVGDQLGTALLIRADSSTILGLPPPPGQKTASKKDAGPVVYEDWTYASTRACAFCHTEAVAQWQTTDHAHAITTLKKKGRDRDPACVGCHSVGFLQPGGTVNLDTVARNFTDVGCESCHGPSAAHVRAPDHNKRSGTRRTVDALVCLGCHTPDQSQGPFEYAAALKEIIGPGHGMPLATDAGRR